MRNFVKRFWNDDAGFIVSAELLFLYTIAVLGLVTGMVAIRNAVIHEMVDVATSLVALDQSFSFDALKGCDSGTNGSNFAQKSVGDDPFIITGDKSSTAGTTIPIQSTQAACP